MPFLPHIRSFCRNLLHGGRADAELDQEVRSYVDLLAEEKMQAGLAPQEALRAARIETGGIEQVTQEVRDTRSGAWLASLLQDLRYAGRTLRKRPGFTITVVLTLALGIGVNTGIFSIVEFMFRSLPVVHPEQLVVLATGQNHQPETEGFSYPEYLDLKQQASTFSDMAGYQVDIEALSAQGQATQFFMT
ncbi:MAG TPA: permease prefix domain 1-containing protein, partial [Terriglobales bacterium]|nr:permease prefix domain 1-containing protein [Terriglobales bacterium]